MQGDSGLGEPVARLSRAAVEQIQLSETKWEGGSYSLVARSRKTSPRVFVLLRQVDGASQIVGVFAVRSDADVEARRLRSRDVEGRYVVTASRFVESR